MLRIFSFLATLLLAQSAFAQQYDRSFRDWSVFKHNGTCYIGTAPIKQEGNYATRGQPYVLVVKRAAGVDEINVSSGYPYKSGKDVTIEIDGKTTKLFSKGETAWAYNEMADAALVKQMKAGNKLFVKGTSPKDTYSTDHYSLIGFTAAYNYMKSQCR